MIDKEMLEEVEASGGGKLHDINGVFFAAARAIGVHAVGRFLLRNSTISGIFASPLRPAAGNS